VLQIATASGKSGIRIQDADARPLERHIPLLLHFSYLFATSLHHRHPMSAIDAFLYSDAAFGNFSPQHFVMLGITALLSVAVPLLSHRVLSLKGCLWVARVIAIITSLTVAIGITLRLWLGSFDPVIDIPLGLCPLLGLLIPFLIWNPNRRVQEVLYFLVLAGTVQAVLTPDLPEAFPHYGFFSYWIYHIGLIVTIIHLTTTLGFVPGKGSLWRAFGWLQAYAAIMFVINITFGTNFFYLAQKPPTASLLDYLGPWPVYILFAEILALLLMGLIYLPAYLVRRKSQPETLPEPVFERILRR
jgi:hypothetical integral membrane protein (TIGR02206 family)